MIAVRVPHSKPKRLGLEHLQNTIHVTKLERLDAIKHLVIKN